MGKRVLHTVTGQRNIATEERKILTAVYGRNVEAMNNGISG